MAGYQSEESKLLSGKKGYEPINEDESEAEDEIKKSPDGLFDKFDLKGRRVSSAADVRMPNLYVSKFQMVTNPVHIDESTLSNLQRKAIRHSLKEPALIVGLPKEEIRKLAKPQTAIKQAMLFCFSVILMGLVPIVETMGLFDPTTGKKTPIHGPLPLLVSYIIGIVFSVLWVSFQSGSAGVASCFNGKNLVLAMPSALAFTFGDWTGLRFNQGIGATLWKVMGQSKLLLTALCAWIFLGQSQNGTQWLILMASSIAIAVYAVGSLTTFELADYGLFITGVVAILITCLAGLVTEYIMKNVQNPFVVQMCHTRLASLTAASFFMLYQFLTEENWVSPISTWDNRMWVLVGSDIVKSWLSMLVVKQLNSTWKSLAAALSLGITYLMSCALLRAYGDTGFHLGNFLIIVAISLNILTYASAKRDEQKMIQLKLDAEREGTKV